MSRYGELEALMNCGHSFDSALEKMGYVDGASSTEPEREGELTDKQRVDWLQESMGKCGYSESTYAGEGFFAHALAMSDKYSAGKTMREAIDAAINDEQPPSND